MIPELHRNRQDEVKQMEGVRTGSGLWRGRCWSNGVDDEWVLSCWTEQMKQIEGSYEPKTVQLVKGKMASAGNMQAGVGAMEV